MNFELNKFIQLLKYVKYSSFGRSLCKLLRDVYCGCHIRSSEVKYPKHVNLGQIRLLRIKSIEIKRQFFFCFLVISNTQNFNLVRS